MLYSLIILIALVAVLIFRNKVNKEIETLNELHALGIKQFKRALKAKDLHVDQIIGDLHIWVIGKYRDIGVNESVQLLDIMHSDLRPKIESHRKDDERFIDDLTAWTAEGKTPLEITQEVFRTVEKLIDSGYLGSVK